MLHCSQAQSVWNLALEQANFYQTWLGSTPNGAVRGHQLTAARAEFGGQADRSGVVQPTSSSAPRGIQTLPILTTRTYPGQHRHTLLPTRSDEMDAP